MSIICSGCYRALLREAVQCQKCGIYLCGFCFNSTNGGRVDLPAGMDEIHTSEHSHFELKQILEPHKPASYLANRSFVSLYVKHTTTSLLQLEEAGAKLRAWLLEIHPSSKEKGASLKLVGLKEEAFLLSYSHANRTLSEEEQSVTEKNLTHNQLAINCKACDFGSLIRETLDSLSYPTPQINALISELESSSRSHKTITFSLLVSSCHLVSESNFTHPPGLLLLWRGQQQAVLDSEDEALRKTRLSTRSFRSLLAPGLESGAYSLLVTHQQLSA